MLKNKKRLLVLSLFSVLFVGFLLPEKLIIPVKDATTKDWHHDTFWYEPWGISIVHKGIDIFASSGTPVTAASYGLVIYKGNLSIGGKTVAVLGPKWRIHYYAHLKDYSSRLFTTVSTGEEIGQVGDTGNAKGKPPHLHYTILTPIPYPWRWDGSTHGWLKMFFLNPDTKLRSGNANSELLP